MVKISIKNLTDAEAALFPYISLVSTLTGKDQTLIRIKPLMDALGNPQNKLKVIHIAGTSGKTSTSYYISELLRSTGKKVGLCVSPHIDSVTERVQLNGRSIPEKLFCSELEAFLEIVSDLKVQLSYFELLYAFAFFVFYRQQVDYAVVETGLGGLFDATNVATARSKICVITDIGFDHILLLGRTLPEIAAQKAGIIHPGNQVFMYEQDDSVMRVVSARVSEQKATLNVIANSKPGHYQNFTENLPDFQKRNWFLGYQTYLFVSARDGLQNLTERQQKQTQDVQVPARMEVVTIGSKQLVMDGAHNGQKMTTFASSFKHRFPGIKPAIAIAVKDSKEAEEIVQPLADLASEVIVTTFRSSASLPAKSMNPDDLAALFRRYQDLKVSVVADPEEAYDLLLTTKSKVRVLTGSFYFISQLRHLKHLA